MRFFGIILSSAALAGCGGSPDAGQPTAHQLEREPVQHSDNNSKKAKGENFVVPTFVQKMLDVDFPADGKLYVQSRGRFDVKPEAAFCHIEADIDPALKKIAPGFYGPGLDGHRNAMIDERHSDGTPCAASAGDLITHWRLINNSNDAPYKLVLAIWQGNIAWVGVIERVEGGSRPQIFNPYNTDPLPFEMEADMKMLSAKFTNQL